MTRSERLLLSLALGAVLAVCSYFGSKVVGRRRPKSLAAILLAAVPRRSLRELQTSGRWVALCGTAFNVVGDPFFDPKCAGIYSSWVNHDVTYLLLQLGLTPDAADDAEAVNSYLDREWQLDALKGEEEAARRRHELVKEWFTRFHSRYEVVAQLSDRYVGAQWDALRAELLPSDSGLSSGGKCPLGFGAKTVSRTISCKVGDVKDLRTIMFQGRRYNVTDSKLFHPDGGQFAHFVGHDVTYALAVQSVQTKDLDVTPKRSYTFEEQLLLERYRNFFAHELELVKVEEEQNESGNGTSMIHLHHVIEESDNMTKEESVQNLQRALARATVEQVNAMCSRTTMTPLHKAVEKHRLDLVTALVHAGAELMARAALYDDETPLEMARRFHLNDIAAYLETITK